MGGKKLGVLEELGLSKQSRGYRVKKAKVDPKAIRRHRYKKIKSRVKSRFKLIASKVGEVGKKLSEEQKKPRKVTKQKPTDMYGGIVGSGGFGFGMPEQKKKGKKKDNYDPFGFY